MRGPILRPWRRYPELDGLSDAECRGLIERRWRREPPPLWMAPVCATGAGGLWLLGVVAVALQSPVTDDAALDQGVVWLVVSSIALGGGLLVAVLAGWSVERALVRSTLRRIVLGATCPRCGHSLIGLPISDDATRPGDQSRMRVRCPECGKVVRLLKHGYSPADFAPWSERVLPKDFEIRIKR